MSKFDLISQYKPAGDQSNAIEKLTMGINKNYKEQTLLGVTGSGKTFTIANIIANTNKPTLVLAHNKTLAAQLCSEFREFFPNNAVEYFVSYYDYYQPEAYIPNTDTYIEKDSSINDEIDKLRHSATSSLFERRDVIIVSSVSCIYGLGDPTDYKSLVVSIRTGMVKDRDKLLKELISIQYERNDIDFSRGKFRVKGDVVEIFPSNTNERLLRVEFFGDEIEKISEVDWISGKTVGLRSHCAIFPASHYVTTPGKLQIAINKIEEELDEQCRYFEEQGKLLEKQRIEQRTRYDIEMLQEVGFCSGIENYSRHINGRDEGSTPYTLMDYFPEDYLLVVDESHVTLPQVRGMYNGDRARKDNLIKYGFRLPSAYDNRPLNFSEFEKKVNQAIYVSATPSVYEKTRSRQVIEQVIRPTGLLDPEIDVRPITGQIDDLLSEINSTINQGFRVLVTTLTKRMAEALTDYLSEQSIKVRYLHSDIDTLERMDIIRDLRLGVFNVLVGINLLREGLDLPEVALVAILDADKEGFLRSNTSLIQTVGRAARNSKGRVIMYADRITPSMQAAIEETNRRREIQHKYNVDNGIVPESIIKAVHNTIEATKKEKANTKMHKKVENVQALIEELGEQMKRAAANLDFEQAATLRDKIKELKEMER